MAIDDKRYRLSVDVEIIETEKFSGTIHTHKRNLAVTDFSTLEAASIAYTSILESTKESQDNTVE